MTPTLRLTDPPEAGQREAILGKLVRFNLARSGQHEDYRPLAVLLEHADTGAVIGGLWGSSFFAHLFVELLFVPEALRGGGVGRQLMAAAEQEARRRDCIGVWLDTFSFQARGFYEKLGYAVFGTIEDYPPGHSRFFLKKTLSLAVAKRA
jgi:GNAT superfamily N-acetyltransferase